MTDTDKEKDVLESLTEAQVQELNDSIENSIAVSQETANPLWDYYNAVNNVTPDRKKRTGSNETLSRKRQILKKKKARKTQKNSRKANRK